MSARALRSAVAFGAGVLFGAGLLLGGMTRPAKVLGFLDVFGAWDPSLLFVMAGAVGVAFLGDRVARRLRAPLANVSFRLPARRAVDTKLLLGAAIFGVGWGLAGYCPGPSVVSLAAGSSGTWVFGLSLVGGVFLASRLEALAARDFGGDAGNAIGTARADR